MSDVNGDDFDRRHPRDRAAAPGDESSSAAVALFGVGVLAAEQWPGVIFVGG
ncbi:hypothetical protein ACWCQW_53650 [Streptomyces mirabilis]